MADSKTAILITLDDAHEGGFQKDYNDRANWTGGEIGVGELVGTNGGITALDMPGADIEHLTEDQKVNYYTENYWKPLYSQINNQQVANKIFDLGVLFGIGEVVFVLQTVLSIAADRVFGPKTLQAVNTVDPTSLLVAFKAGLITHAIGIINARPTDRQFFAGWVKRINS